MCGSKIILAFDLKGFMLVLGNIIIYIQRKIFFRATIFLYSPCHYMRAWIRVLEAPGCYERAALQGSGLVRTVGPYVQRSNVCTKKSSLNASGHSYS